MSIVVLLALAAGAGAFAGEPCSRFHTERLFDGEGRLKAVTVELRSVEAMRGEPGARLVVTCREGDLEAALRGEALAGLPAAGDEADGDRGVALAFEQVGPFACALPPGEDGGVAFRLPELLVGELLAHEVLGVWPWDSDRPAPSAAFDLRRLDEALAPVLELCDVAPRRAADVTAGDLVGDCLAPPRLVSVPDEVHAWRGEIDIELVVDERGRARPGELERSTLRRFGAEVRRSLLRWRFEPARLYDQPIPFAFRFQIDLEGRPVIAGFAQVDGCHVCPGSSKADR
jgi:hypothetical protein